MEQPALLPVPLIPSAQPSGIRRGRRGGDAIRMSVLGPEGTLTGKVDVLLDTTLALERDMRARGRVLADGRVLNLVGGLVASLTVSDVGIVAAVRHAVHRLVGTEAIEVDTAVSVGGEGRGVAVRAARTGGVLCWSHQLY